jgi:D-alanyl-D-alanine carboxypeptidase (penicillin-binding protein 5/6)
LTNWRFLLPIALVLSGAVGAAPDASTIIVTAIPLEPPSQAQAPIALLADISSGQILYARAADKRMLPASMTKAMTALVVFDLIKQGKLNEDTIVTVSPAAARLAGKGTTLNLRLGEKVRLGDLLMGTTTVSANDAAIALAEAALGSEARFIETMNAYAQALGMNGSRFASVNGLPDGGKTYVTANDMIRLATALVAEHPALYHKYFGQKSMIWRGGQYNSRSPFAGILPGSDGIKTGHTREAGYNFLGAVERDGRRLVLVIGGSPSEAARADASRGLAEWGYHAWGSHAFLTPGFVVGAAKVQGGDARQVQLTVPRAFTLSLPNAGGGLPTGKIVYQGPLKAPLAKGKQVGRLEISVPGQPGYALPLVTTQAVAPAGTFDRIGNGLLGLFE